MKLPATLRLLGLTCLFAASAAIATPATFDFTGTVLFGDLGQAGDAVSGEMTFDYGASGSDIGSSSFALYGFATPVFQESFTLDGVTYNSGSYFSVLQYSVAAGFQAFAVDDTFSGMGVSADAVLANGLPDIRDGRAQGTYDENGDLGFSINTLGDARVLPVPAPTGALLLGFGLVGLLAAKRRPSSI